jgi:prepilin-type N-terminal cleavage/methylation domain-containing protein
VIGRVRRRLRVRGEAGYSLVEMITVMVIMTIVFAGITSVFVAGSRAQNEQDRRFQAQLSTRLALDKIRRDIHCANDVSPNTPNPWTSAQTSVTLLIPSGCSGGNVTWCTAAVTGYSNRYRLYRQLGSSCSSASGTMMADYLTSDAPFTAFAHVTGCLCLASLGIDFKVSLKGSTTVDAYELTDTIYLRNSTRI